MRLKAKILIVGLVMFIYTGAVVIFAMPLQYGSKTVYREAEPAKTATITVATIIKPTAEVKPLQVKKMTSLAQVSPAKAELVDYAKEQAEFHDLDPEMFAYIIKCESAFDSTANHDGGNGKGVTGFWRETFERWNKKFYNGTLVYSNQQDQIKLMARAFQEGEEYRNDWSSWNKYKKYGTCYNYEIRKLNKKT